MIVIFLHGWSVRHTDTYGALPQWLAQQPALAGKKIKISNVFLGKYISFRDSITLDDIARAFQEAIRSEAKLKPGQKFACITHSTGGPVVRRWLTLFHPKGGSPLSHLIMLAPPNHGSALAQVARQNAGTLKSLLDGVEAGHRILSWLEVGSPPQWDLNRHWLDYPATDPFTFVFTGQRIDRKLYDHLNSYTGEPGSDGVVRAASANMNYRYLRLRQKGEEAQIEEKIARPVTAFGILPGISHSGNSLGILRSVTLANASSHPTAQWVWQALQVHSIAGYRRLSRELEKLTALTQKQEEVEKVRKLFDIQSYITHRHSLLLFRIVDHRGEALTDYALYLTAGPKFSEDELPRGFFVDRQRRQQSPNHLSYYLDYDVIHTGLNRRGMAQRLGLKIKAHPSHGLAFFRPLLFQSVEARLETFLRPNETTMVEIVMERLVDSKVLHLTDDLTAGDIDETPTGRLIPREG